MSDVARDVLQPFIQYFERQWLTSITSDGMRIYNLDQMSTNEIEANNAVMLRNLVIRPCAWDFGRKFVNFIYILFKYAINVPLYLC